MGVTVTRNFPPLADLPLITQPDWQAAGQLLRERIVRRTIAGLDVQGQAFAPYSPRYAKQRQQAGMDTATVTLQVSGEMLRGIQVIASADRVELTF